MHRARIARRKTHDHIFDQPESRAVHRLIPGSVPEAVSGPGPGTAPDTAVSQAAWFDGASSAPARPALEISQPSDPEEREARQMADDALHGSGVATTRPGSDHGSRRPGGTPLPTSTRSYFEPRFGHDFSKVRIHADTEAGRAARRVDAHAFTADRHVYFAPGRFDTRSASGRQLLAHELAHVVQSNPVSDSSLAVHRWDPSQGNAPAAESTRNASATPPRAALQVSFSGMTFTPPGELTFAPGPKLPQGLAIVLRRLIGDQYRPGLETALLDHLRATLTGFGVLGLDGSSDGSDPLIPIRVDAWVSSAIVGWIRQQGYEVGLTEVQLEILAGGIYLEEAWRQLSDQVVQDELGFSFPEWYGKHIFFNEMARRGALLHQYAFAIMRYRESRSPADRELIRTALNEVVEALLPAMIVVDTIKYDDSLRDHEAYRTLFGSPPSESPESEPEPESTEGAAPEAPQGPNQIALSMFITFIGSQPELSGRIVTETDSAPRRELLDRFIRYMDRASFGQGDQVIRDTPGGANAPPHPATLASYPALEPPLFDAALGTDHAFVMTLQFPSVFDALARYAYGWNRIQVPDEMIEQGGNVEELEGERPSTGEVAGARFRRAGRYMATDVQRTIRGIGNSLDVAPGLSAPTLAAANGILRFIGTGISLGFEILTEPQYTKRVVFPEEGLYLVRSIATPVLGGNEEIVRASSVSYLPVFARSPQEMAEKRVRLTMSSEARGGERLLELQAMLSEPMTHENQEALEQEYSALNATLGSMEDALNFQRDQIEKRQKEIPRDSQEYAQLQRRLDELKLMIQHRQERAAARPLHRAERLPATFVGDRGQTISLALEAVRVNEAGPLQEYYISDVTTKRSGHETGRGSTKHAAITAALRKLLEGRSGYGRGYCSVAIEGRIETLRIDASEGMLMMEALENLATVASIAAVAAAPFTGGASLSLLLPIGVVGMVPSAYRLAGRAEAGTLHFDLDLAMELVNIAGGLAGLGAAATPLRSIRLGKALLVTGVGSDGLGVVLMGAGMVEQIEALSGEHPSLRTARIMEIVGMGLVQAGIMAGSHLTSRARQTDVETAMAASDPQLNRWLTVQSSDSVRVGGAEHRVQIGVENGRVVVRLCSSCLVIVRRIEQLQQRPDIQENTPLRERLDRIDAQARKLEADMNEGRISRADAETAIDALTREMNDLATTAREQARPDNEPMSTPDDNRVWDDLFSGGDNAGEYSTSQRLVRGNLGERLATDWLAAEGHTILSYKPDITGTNQGGIDMVTMRNGTVYLIDNKALSRSGNVSSVSALTTNFSKNLQAVRAELQQMISRPEISASERRIIQQALDALDAGNYVRAVTNANVTESSVHTTGVTERLAAQGIQFIDVMSPVTQ
jgi:Holliday junction resolvase-like predicted endonuclease